MTACEFSPDNKFLSVATKGSKFKIFESPIMSRKTYAPMVLYKKYGNLHSGDISGISWSEDSRFFITWSEDLTIKMMSLHKIPNYLPFTFSGYNSPIV